MKHQHSTRLITPKSYEFVSLLSSVASDHQNDHSSLSHRPFRVVPTRTLRTLFQSFYVVHLCTSLRVSFKLTSSPASTPSHSLNSKPSSTSNPLLVPTRPHLNLLLLWKFHLSDDKSFLTHSAVSFSHFVIASLLSLWFCSRPFYSFPNFLTSKFSTCINLSCSNSLCF